MFLIAVLGTHAYSQTLIFQYSDSHSAYHRVPGFLNAMAVRIEAFRARHPEGKVIILANGDISGAELSTEYDAGDFNYTILSELAKLYDVIVIPGNHEGYDFVGAEEEDGMQPNELFFRQNQRLINGLRTNGRYLHMPAVLAANIVPTIYGSQIFQPSQDLALPGGASVKYGRVVGFTVPNLKISSSYDESSPFQIFYHVREILDVAKSEMLRAARDHVDVMILAMHEEIAYVRPIADELLEWKDKQPDLNGLKVALISAAHDHYIYDERIGKTAVIDAGSMYAFSEIELDDEGDVVNTQHWSHELQEQLGEPQKMHPIVQSLIDQAHFKVNQVLSGENLTVLGHIPGLKETKLDLELGRKRLGNQLANALQSWGRDVLSNEPNAPDFETVIAFYNSTAYRSETHLPEGPITVGDIKRMVPFRRPSKLLILGGEQVLAMFKSLRRLRERKSNYSPQIPDNIRELPGYQLEYQDAQGQWVPVRKEGRYALALDYNLSRNFYRLPEYDAAYENAEWQYSGRENTQHILIRYLPREMACKAALEP